MRPLHAILFAAVAACHSRGVPAGDSSSGAAASVVPVVRTQAAELESMPVPGTCATLRDVAASDIVRLEGDTLFVADETRGLAIVDVRDPDHPTPRSQVPFVGTPFRLFVRQGIAWLVYVDWDRAEDGPATVLRAFDVRDVDQPRALGEVRRSAIADDAQLLGGVLYLLHGEEGGGVVESFAVRKSKLESLDRAVIRGRPVQLAASAAGLVATSVARGEVMATHFGIPLDSGGQLLARNTVRLAGGLPLRSPSRVAEIDDGGELHLVVCGDASCSADAKGRLVVIPDGTTTPKTYDLFARGGFPVTRFSQGRLFAAMPAPTRDTSELRAVDFGASEPRLGPPITLRGAAASIADGANGVVVLGVLGGPRESKRLVLHDVASGGPRTRLRGSVAFGADWTSSTALDASEAVSFDPITNLVAVPFAAFDTVSVRWAAGAQVVDVSEKAPLLSSVAPAPSYVTRAVFVHGKLLVVGDEIRTFDLAPTLEKRDLRYEAP